MEAPRLEPSPADAPQPERPRRPGPPPVVCDPSVLEPILRAAAAIFPDHAPLRGGLVAYLALLASRRLPPPTPRSFAYGLWASGWKLLEPTEKPRAGDLFLVAGPDRAPKEIGLVAKVSTDGGWFLAVDAGLAPGERPHRRQISGGDHAPVASWLRFG